MPKIKEEYKVVSGFYDLEDVLKTQPRGRHYSPDKSKGATKYPAVSREVTDERIQFLKDNKFIE